MKCYICDNEENNKTITAREMHSGTREAFDYMECSKCKCIQIVEKPSDISRYLDADRQAFASVSVLDFSSYDKSDEFKFILWASLYMYPYLHGFEMKSLNHSILEINCGNGQITRTLGAMGFKKAVGIDEQLLPCFEYESDNCVVYKENFYEVDGKFDFIILNDCLQRMDRQRDALLKIKELLSDTGVCYISMPIAAYTWHKYEKDWHWLHPPRHLMIHSFDSLNLLLEQTGFKIKGYKTQSSNVGFVFSEMYKKDISWKEYMSQGLWNRIPKEEADFYSSLANKLDAVYQGDQLILYIIKDREENA